MAIPFYSDIDLNGNEIQNYKIQSLTQAPENPLPGQQYYNNSDNTLYYFNGTDWVQGGGSSSGNDNLPIGIIIEWPSDTIPDNYLLCDGREISRTEYKELFDVIGIIYGQGDGSTTFNLPDKRGKFTVGKDSNEEAFNSLGKKGGSSKKTLTLANIPSHTHTFTANAHTHTLSAHTHSIPAHAHGLNAHKHSFSGTSNSTGAHTHTINSNGEHEHYGLFYSDGRTIAMNRSSGDTKGVGLSWDGDAFIYGNTSINTGSTGAHTHTAGNSGTHSHTVSGTTGGASGSTANSSALTSGSATPTANNATVTGKISSTGSGEEFDITNPYITLNYIIKAKKSKDQSGNSDQGQVALKQASINIENPIEANTDYSIPLNYIVGADDLEVFYCGNKLQKDTDYVEIGSSNSTSNKIQFKTSIGDLDMSGITGFENFKETLQFTVTGKSTLDQINELNTRIQKLESLTDRVDTQVSMSTPGWYRIAYTEQIGSPNPTTCIIKLGSAYNYSTPMTSILAIATASDKGIIQNLTQIINMASTKVYSKVRLQSQYLEDVAKRIFYLDVYYTVDVYNNTKLNLLCGDNYWKFTSSLDVTEYTTVIELSL